MGNWIRKHRNHLLICLLALTMTVSSLVKERETPKATPTVSLPISETAAVPRSALDQYKETRDTDALRDMAALEVLINQEALDPQTRADAAAQLQHLVDRRQKQTALEGALSQSGIYPCAAVVDTGCVTIVTEKETLSEGETALVLTMAQLHADVMPSGVRVITAQTP